MMSQRRSKIIIPITMTPNAIQHVKKIIQQQGHGIGFRLYLTTAGCSGIMYKSSIIDEPIADDYCFDACEAFKIYVEKKAYPFIKGTEIDFVNEGLNQIFKYRNPNETGSCGCGESFTVDERFNDA